MFPFHLPKDLLKLAIDWIRDGGQTIQNTFIVFLIGFFSFRTEIFPQEFGAISHEATCSTGGLVPIGFFCGMFIGAVIGTRLFKIISKQGKTALRLKLVVIALTSALVVAAFVIDHVYDKTISENVSEYPVASEARSQRIVFPDKYETAWHGQVTSNWHNQWATDVLTMIGDDVDLKAKAHDACELLKAFATLRIFLLSASLALILIASIEFLRANSGKAGSRSKSHKPNDDRAPGQEMREK